MTRKDYILIAGAIANTVRTSDGSLAQLAAILATASNIANELQTDNSSFDRERFMNACGF